MPDKVWKAVERKLARRFGTTRVGARDDVQMDIDAGHLSIEVKHRDKLPKWIKDAVVQAIRNAGVSQLPIVILHESGQRHDNDIVMMRLKDYEEWYGPASKEGSADWAVLKEGEVAMRKADDCEMDVEYCDDCSIRDICWGLDKDALNQAIYDYERRIEEETDSDR